LGWWKSWFQPTSPLVVFSVQLPKFERNGPWAIALTRASYAAYSALSDGYVRNTTMSTAGVGCMHVTVVELVSLQEDGGSMPFAVTLTLTPATAFARLS